MAVASMKSDTGFVDNWQSGKSLAECNLRMLTSEDSCDVSFRVGKDKKKVRAHRYVLISRSCVFHAMLCGPLAEKDEITVSDVEPEIFHQLLRFLYTNELEPTPLNVTSLLYLAKKYAMGGLEHLCLTYLKSSLSAENACVILEQAHVFDEKQLYDRAMQVIVDNGGKCLSTEGFRHLCCECFHKVIGSDRLHVKPENIFCFSLVWTEEECRREGRDITPVSLRSILGRTLFLMPFPDMKQKYYLNEVIPRQILTSKENIVITAHHQCPENDPSPFRSRRNKIRTGRQLDFSEVIFYNKRKHVRVSGFEKIFGGIYFSCSYDVIVLGVYVYGSKEFDTQNYRLNVEQYSSKGVSSCLMNCECHSTADTRFSTRMYIRTMYLDEPLNIKHGLKHYLSVTLLSGDEPEFEGGDIIKDATVGRCIFNNISNNYLQPLNLIYGRILKQ